VVLLPFKAPVAVEPPLTLLEAMACETAVIVAAHANRSRIVRDGWNGMTFGSPEELAARLRQLAALHAPARAALGLAARAAVEERHSFVAVGQALAALWAALADVRGVQRPSGFVKREV
jgi:glycosyltransferase involved in cell wall biosynthesis